MNRRGFLLLGLCAASGVLWFLSASKFDIWPLAWLAQVPSLWATERASTDRRAFLLGWVTGAVANTGGFYWIKTLLTRFAQLPWPLAVLGLLLLSVYQGIVFGLFAWVARKIRRTTKLPMAVVAPLVMVTFELLVPFVFPWYLAITQAWQPLVIQIADLTGPLGVSALILVVNGGLYDAIVDRRYRPAAAAAAVLALGLGYGALRLHQMDAAMAAAPKVRVGLVQGNVAFDMKGVDHPDYADHQIAELQDRSVDLERQGADLIVWTESSYPYWLPRFMKREPPSHGVRSRGGRRLFETPLLFGAITYEVDATGQYDTSKDPYNTAIMLDPDGKFVGRFDKMFLVMFSEHIPLSDTFPFIKKILPRAAGNFTRGAGPTVFPLHTRDGRDFTLGPMICFEDILPGYGRAVGALHPDLLVNITNDAWFGDTSEPWEHMALSVYRAVEQRSVMVRAVNTGVTAIVDAGGRVVRKTYAVDPAVKPTPADTLVGDVAMLSAGHTVYAVVGDVFGYACAGVTGFLWLVLPRLRRRRKGEPVTSSGRRAA